MARTAMALWGGFYDCLLTFDETSRDGGRMMMIPTAAPSLAAGRGRGAIFGRMNTTCPFLHGMTWGQMEERGYSRASRQWSFRGGGGPEEDKVSGRRSEALGRIGNIWLAGCDSLPILSAATAVVAWRWDAGAASVRNSRDTISIREGTHPARLTGWLALVWRALLFHFFAPFFF